MVLTPEEVAAKYPIHWLVWNDNHEELLGAIKASKFTSEDIEVRDPQGRTPLLLAVTLGKTECVKLLLDAGADVNCEKDGWSAVQEATATGDIDLLQLVLGRRDHQRYLFRSRGIPDLLNRLSLAPDFYVEMRWQFTSWMPLIARICPSDTYKVYKRGANVRVDTTLIGFENRSWLRGDISYVFKGQGTTARFMEVNHEAGSISTEVIDGTDLWPQNSLPRLRALRRRLQEPIAINYLDTDKISFERNKSGIWGWRQDKIETVNGYDCKVFSANNVEIVSKTRCEHLPRGAPRTPRPPPFAPLLALDAEMQHEEPQEIENRPRSSNRAGKPGTSFDKTKDAPTQAFAQEYIKPLLEDTINIPDTRTDSSSGTSGFYQQLGGDSRGKPPTTVWQYRREKKLVYDSKPPEVFESSDEEGENKDKSFQEEEPPVENSSGSESPTVVVPATWQEYFSGEPLRQDIGRPKEMTTKVQKFKATLSLCEDYPLELQEQIMPILDLMTAIASPHFAKLKDFIQMQLPAGFPVKIEIPLFHVMNARITFGNIFGTETNVPFVSSIQEGDRLSCVIEDQCFDIGRHYKEAGNDDRLSCQDSEEGLLQYAIQQSLMEAGTHDDQVDVWEALRGARPSSPAPPRAPAPEDLLAHDEKLLQRAIEASLASLVHPGELPAAPVDASMDTAVDADLLAALALSAEEQSAADAQRAAEQQAIDEALRLSLLEK